MPRTTTARVSYETVADLLGRLQGIAPRRIRLKPFPGTAKERDLIRLNERKRELYELVEGVLVEKVMGFIESVLACDLIVLLGNYLRKHDVGFIAGESGPLRLRPGLVRIPDVSFIRWDRVGGEIPREAIGDVVPDLAVEVLSEGNTAREMNRKLQDYFQAGVRLVWFVDPDHRLVEVYTAPDHKTVLTEKDALDGGEVLPGLKLPVREVFARLPKPPGRKKANGKRKAGPS